ncbi:unnamed protein product [Paramecium pentaurelia]|uniref:Uncharacterized protein n=1 Tax=Paramecium pentaurelia TaxID=43138 RepID=A0A8S1WUJ4_9CILI|nr:unnamed protein product [Paramecium pentaurelia]
MVYLINNYELCDDGNNGNNVGDDRFSSMCLIEDNQNCNNQFFQSICFPKTQILLTYLNHTNSNQYAELSFSNQVNTIESNVNSIDCIHIKLSTKNYSVTIKEVVGINQQVYLFLFMKFKLNFLIQQLIKYYQLISIQNQRILIILKLPTIKNISYFNLLQF